MNLLISATKLTLLFFMSALVFVACQHSAHANEPLRIEAENSFKNIGDQKFGLEEGVFYSGGMAILIQGAAPIGKSGTVEYDLSQQVPKGVYNVSIHYNDENDGHSPVAVMLDDQTYSFVMNAATPSAFSSADNQRSTTFKNVVVTQSSKLRITGTVHRYESEHRELVRLDYFTFTPVSSS